MDQTLQKAIMATHITARALALASSGQKNIALGAMREEILASREAILEANARDMDAAATQKTPAAGDEQTAATEPTIREDAVQKNSANPMLDRLLLTAERLDAIAGDMENVTNLPDPVGEVLDTRTRPNGLRIERVRVPIGTILMIYESRPNVTVDSAVLSLKSGNTIVLKGGKEALNTNRALAEAMKRGLQRVQDKTGIPSEAICFIDTTDRSVVGELLNMRGVIDVVVPRGGKGLINFVTSNARIPVIETGASVVHVFVDEKADMAKAIDIVVNAKTRRVSICNTLDVLLVHGAIAAEFLPRLGKALEASSAQKPHPMVEIRCDEQAQKIMESAAIKNITPLDPKKDYDTEFLDYILAIHVVESLDEALAHIAQHSLKHSEAIITEDENNARRFLNEVDAACVYHNASTQFSDGAQFGLGAEMGISTQKFHARGPFALEGLTTYKWVIHGSGQIRPA